jgi:hypothetical protein
LQVLLDVRLICGIEQREHGFDPFDQWQRFGTAIKVPVDVRKGRQTSGNALTDRPGYLLLERQCLLEVGQRFPVAVALGEKNTELEKAFGDLSRTQFAPRPAQRDVEVGFRLGVVTFGSLVHGDGEV